MKNDNLINNIASKKIKDRVAELRKDEAYRLGVIEERKRCSDIVQSAREEGNTDLRSIIYSIINP